MKLRVAVKKCLCRLRVLRKDNKRLVGYNERINCKKLCVSPVRSDLKRNSNSWTHGAPAKIFAARWLHQEQLSSICVQPEWKGNFALL